MHYLILAIGLLLAGYAAFRFFLKASPEQIKSAFLTVSLCAVALGLLFLAATGRLPAALGLVAAILPFLPSLLKKRAAKAQPPATPTPAAMTREEALKILGLDDEADKKSIQSAYKALMKKLHPDQEGSEWLAAKLNEARDFLLKDQ
ncbi:MAG TPA: DnaJ domain-containing protein [Alphaproteobacteria bacterium]|nr:DnaJ domain-containing protein [Alphaproteobacteria bacterium]